MTTSGGKNAVYLIAGEAMTGEDIHRVFGVPPHVIRDRIVQGWSPTDAAMTPKGRQRRILPTLDRYMRNWRQLCEQYRLPLTEDDWVEQISVHTLDSQHRIYAKWKRRQVHWIPREPQKKIGCYLENTLLLDHVITLCTTAWNLCSARESVEATMIAWGWAVFGRTSRGPGHPHFSEETLRGCDGFYDSCYAVNGVKELLDSYPNRGSSTLPNHLSYEEGRRLLASSMSLTGYAGLEFIMNTRRLLRELYRIIHIYDLFEIGSDERRKAIECLMPNIPLPSVDAMFKLKT